MSFVLRDYQEEAIQKALDAFTNGSVAPLIVMPTGSGKAASLCTFIKRVLEAWPDQRILQLVHVRELVKQNAQTMFKIWPQAPISICSAGLNSRNVSGQIVFASIQSIYKRAFDLQRVDLVIVDECHLIPPSGDGMYNRLLDDLATINGHRVPMLGFTATDYRASSGSLTEGKGKIFDSVAYEIGIKELIDRGFLCPPIAKTTKTEMNGEGVGTRGGEFIQSQLQAKYDRDDVTEAACDELVEMGEGRKRWLIFSTGVAHAKNIRDAIRARGYSSEIITGKTPKGERDAIVKAFNAGEIRSITNDSVLTTGFDSPAVDLIGVMRPIKSPGLWVQIIGRGTRLSPGKEDCLVLDYGRNSERFGPIDQIKATVKGEGGVPPMKTCPECGAIILAAAGHCPECGHEFPIERERATHAKEASTAPIMSSKQPQWIEVDDLTYSLHAKHGKIPSMKASYYCGLNAHHQWICFEHEGFARRKAEQWWRKRTYEVPPDTIEEALSRIWGLPKPIMIAVRPNGKFSEIVGERFK